MAAAIGVDGISGIAAGVVTLAYFVHPVEATVTKHWWVMEIRYNFG